MKTFPANFRKMFLLLLAFTFVAALPAAAHCDTLTGPVVTAARRALETGNINTVLKWVHPEFEQEVRTAFANTRKVRLLNADARELADKYFFDTVVRLHRTGEGEPYTGLKSAADVEPAIAALDKALESGDAKAFLDGFGPEAASQIRQRFARAQQARLHADDSLAAGREYVAAYVDLIHYMHGLEAGEHAEHAAAASEHSPKPGAPAATKAEIDRFTAGKIRLKKNDQTKLVLAFRAEPMGAHVQWRLSCTGVAITGWDAGQLLSVAERVEGGAIQTIEGRDYVVAGKSVVIGVKRPKTAPANGEASCTVALEEPASEQQRTIKFETAS